MRIIILHKEIRYIVHGYVQSSDKEYIFIITKNLKKNPLFDLTPFFTPLQGHARSYLSTYVKSSSEVVRIANRVALGREKLKATCRVITLRLTDTDCIYNSGTTVTITRLVCIIVSRRYVRRVTVSATPNSAKKNMYPYTL